MGMVHRDIAHREQPDLFSYTPPKASPQIIAAVKPAKKARTERMRQMLGILNSGKPVSSTALHKDYHRAAATICDLREMGHQIDSFNVGEESFYRYTGYETRVAVSKGMQAAYLETSHWRYVAGVRREIDDYTCQQCKSRKELQVHHWVYNLFEENARYELITLCDPCHGRWHTALTGSRIHFPRYVSKEVAAKMGWKQ
jgi:hypothetical protein